MNGKKLRKKGRVAKVASQVSSSELRKIGNIPRLIKISAVPVAVNTLP